MKKEFHSSVLSLANVIVKYTEAVKDSYDPELIHKLRTSFKKLRALLRWQKTGKRSYADFKKTYAVAGEIRNIQVVQEMLKKEEDIPQHFQYWLSVTLRKIKKEWNKTDHKTILKQLAGTIKKIKLSPIKNKHFFSKRIKRTEQVLSVDPVADNSLHDIRKMTKDMQYILEWWEKKIGKPQQLVSKVSVNKLKIIAKQIGEYNDKRILLILLQNYARQEKDPALISEINPVIATWQEIKILEKEKLVAILHYEKIH